MKKRNKVAIIIAVLLMAIFCMSACGESSEDRESKDIVEEDNKPATFICISDEYVDGTYGLEQYILYDPETMIMWTFFECGDAGGLSMITLPDGTPKLYEPK